LEGKLREKEDNIIWERWREKEIGRRTVEGGDVCGFLFCFMLL